MAPDSATFTPLTATQSIMVTAGDVSDATVGYACSTVKPPDFHLERAIRDSLNITSGAITCTDLATLTELYASGYGITDSTLDRLQYAPQLTYLDLGDNLLTALDTGALKAMSTLETLYLSNNQLSDIAAETFAGHGALKELALDHNSFAALPEGSFTGLDGLTSLVLDGNALGVVPEQVLADVPLLETLRLRATGLTELTSNLFAGLPELRYLDLGANDITVVAPDAFSGLVQLQHLDLAYNELTELPSGWASDLSELDFLTLRENQLTAVVTGMFTGAENLTWLDLMNNELTKVSDGAFEGLPLLTDLLLRDNKLTDLTSRTFDGLPVLRILWLSENQLDTLSTSWFSDLPTLAVLRLEENCLQLTKVPVVGVLEELTVPSVSTADNPRTDQPCGRVGPTITLFGEGPEGWTAPAATVTWARAGFMTVTGVGYELLVSPPEYQGDASAYLDTRLGFRIKQSAMGTPASGADVIIASGAGLLTYDLPFEPTTDWTYAKIPLSARAPWRTATGAVASEADLRATLSDVHSINIRWKHSDEPGIVTSIDDIVFGVP